MRTFLATLPQNCMGLPCSNMILSVKPSYTVPPLRPVSLAVTFTYQESWIPAVWSPEWRYIRTQSTGTTPFATSTMSRLPRAVVSCFRVDLPDFLLAMTCSFAALAAWGGGSNASMTQMYEKALHTTCSALCLKNTVPPYMQQRPEKGPYKNEYFPHNTVPPLCPCNYKFLPKKQKDH